MDVLILLCLLLEIKLTKLWLCILLNHIACHSTCMECEIWLLNSMNVRKIDIIWNIMGFDVFLTAAGEKALNSSSFIVELCRYLIL